jgi:hypothetical protein
LEDHYLVVRWEAGKEEFAKKLQDELDKTQIEYIFGVEHCG